MSSLDISTALIVGILPSGKTAFAQVEHFDCQYPNRIRVDSWLNHVPEIEPPEIESDGDNFTDDELKAGRGNPAYLLAEANHFEALDSLRSQDSKLQPSTSANDLYNASEDLSASVNMASAQSFSSEVSTISRDFGPRRFPVSTRGTRFPENQETKAIRTNLVVLSNSTELVTGHDLFPRRILSWTS